MFTLPEPVMKFGSKVMKWGIKNGPAIMHYSGLAMTGVGIVMACDATLKADDIIERHKDRMSRIKQAREISLDPDSGLSADEVYTDKQMKQDKLIVYRDTAIDFVKLYGPSVAVICSGLGLVQGAYGVMNDRNAKTMAALTAANEAYNNLLARSEVSDNPIDIATEKLEEPERIVISKGIDNDEPSELLLENYIPIEQWPVIENDPFTIVFDEGCEGWNKDTNFIINANQLICAFRGREMMRSAHSVPCVWVNDIRRDLFLDEKALGWSHGWTDEPGDVIDYDIYMYTYDIIDGMIVGFKQMPGDTNLERTENIKAYENEQRQNDGWPHDYCVVMRMGTRDKNGVLQNPRYIRNEMFG